MLGLVLRSAVDMPLADYLSTRIWAPMGAEADASWGVDNSGQETAQCCLSAVARDWLRLGLLLAADGVRRTMQLFERVELAYYPEDGSVHPEPLGWAALVRDRLQSSITVQQIR